MAKERVETPPSVPPCACEHRRGVHTNYPPDRGPINDDTRLYTSCGTIYCRCQRYEPADELVGVA